MVGALNGGSGIGGGARWGNCACANVMNKLHWILYTSQQSNVDYSKAILCCHSNPYCHHLYAFC